MKKRMSDDEPLTNEDGEVREFRKADFRRLRPAKEVLPPELYAILPKRRQGERGPGKKPVKTQITLRLAPDLIAAYRATGAGWQVRMAEAIERQRPT